MVRKTVYLDDGMDIGIKRIARCENRSVSEVIREAIKRFLRGKEHRCFLRYDKRVARYLRNPSTAVPFRDGNGRPGAA